MIVLSLLFQSSNNTLQHSLLYNIAGGAPQHTTNATTALNKKIETAVLCFKAGWWYVTVRAVLSHSIASPFSSLL
jgi:hypothetical protein